MVSTVDAHAENDPEFRDWPPHCVAGTAGQQKPCQTLLDDGSVVVPSGAADYSVEGARQIVVEKQTIDVFASGKLADVAERLKADRWVIYGVVTEYCVRSAALRLLETGKPVEIVQDAIQALSPESGQAALNEITAKGAKLTNIAAVVSGH